MKKMLLNFAEGLLSREQMRVIKGGDYYDGYGGGSKTCPPDQPPYECTVNYYDDAGDPMGGAAGITCAPNAYEAERKNRHNALQQGFGNKTWADCCGPIQL